MSARARPAERGQILVFVVILAAGLLLVTGLTYDGGRALTAKTRAIDVAEAAARTGAQQVDQATYRVSHRVVLDPAAATAAAQSYLSSTGDSGEITLQGDRIKVTVRMTIPAYLLSAAGLSSLTVTGTGSARARAAP